MAPFFLCAAICPRRPAALVLPLASLLGADDSAIGIRARGLQTLVNQQRHRLSWPSCVIRPHHQTESRPFPLELAYVVNPVSRQKVVSTTDGRGASRHNRRRHSFVNRTAGA